MDRGNIFSGGSFRATLYGTIVFLVVMALSGLLGHRFVKERLEDDLRSQIDASAASFEAVFRDDGRAGLVETMTRMAPELDQSHHIAALFDETGVQIAGNRQVSPDIPNWSIQLVADAGGTEGEPARYYLKRVPLNGMTMMVGRDMRFIDQIELRLIQSLIAIGGLMTLVFITLGYRISRSVQDKLEQMATILGRVATGDGDARLPVSAANDQIDRVSRAMNIHLDRLSEVMHSTRTSAAAIAHDLRRPMSRATLEIERTLRIHDLSEQARSQIEEVRGELANLTGIFASILRIARIDAAMAEPLDGFVDLGELVRDMGETYAVVAEESGQTLVLEIEAASPLETRGDRGMIGQLIANLVENAITHCPAGAVIMLAVRGAADQARIPDLVQIIVSDTGPGIPEADRDRVFDAFYRTDAARTSEGNGLGLAMVRSIADRHGAAISLEDNAPGLRVTVTFARR